MTGCRSGNMPHTICRGYSRTHSTQQNTQYTAHCTLHTAQHTTEHAKDHTTAQRTLHSFHGREFRFRCLRVHDHGNFGLAHVQQTLQYAYIYMRTDEHRDIQYAYIYRHVQIQTDSCVRQSSTTHPRTHIQPAINPHTLANRTVPSTAHAATRLLT